ncbi:MAG: restriction endonuclease subunit S, partial [Leptospirillia bacterium]
AMNLNQYSISAAQPGLSVEIVSNLNVPVPSKSEQLAIASFLDQGIAKIDSLITKAHQAIELLHEHRSSLISAAVTGKIDVRDYVISETVNIGVGHE